MLYSTRSRSERERVYANWIEFMRTESNLCELNRICANGIEFMRTESNLCGLNRIYANWIEFMRTESNLQVWKLTRSCRSLFLGKRLRFDKDSEDTRWCLSYSFGPGSRGSTCTRMSRPHCGRFLNAHEMQTTTWLQWTKARFGNLCQNGTVHPLSILFRHERPMRTQSSKRSALSEVPKNLFNYVVERKAGHGPYEFSLKDAVKHIKQNVRKLARLLQHMSITNEDTFT